MPELPTGTLTFLFTDIEGSTRLWEEQPAAMSRAHARHGALVQLAVEPRGGVIVRNRGEGDSTFSVFTDAAAAVQAACALQVALLAEQWPAEAPIRVRAALHTGVAEPGISDYNSSDVNRCARLRGIAAPGQTLISQATRDAAGEGGELAVAYKDLGWHRLKDLQKPEHVYQLQHALLPADFPPLRSLDSLPNNLPRHLSSFVGREAELQQVHELVGKSRLVTLTGSGGCGKTRLALQAAAELMDGYPDGAWICELAPVADPALVPRLVADVLGVGEESERSVIEGLVEHLRSRSALIVLDNCEHQVAAAATLAEAVLRSCPRVQIMATSQEILRIVGEAAWRVPSLHVPAEGGTGDTSGLARCEAVRLFVERAAAARPGFALTTENGEGIAQVCRRLDGIPLAIELAAARINVLSPAQIAERLDDRFRLLTGGTRTALPRQQTLRALIDWSYNLLNEAERALLRRLSVFAGGWTLEAAEAICADSDIVETGFHSVDVLDLLQALVDKSLVVAEETAGTLRYRLLETLRQYGRERLAEADETVEFRAAHCGYYASLAKEAEPNLTGSQQVTWLNRLGTEHDNLRAALEYCRSTSKQAAETGLLIATALWRFWMTRGYFVEGTSWLAAFLDLTADDGRTSARGRALTSRGRLTGCLRRYDEAQALLEEGRAICEGAGDRKGASVALLHMGVHAGEQARFTDATDYFEHSLALQRQIGDQRGIAMSLGNLGAVAMYLQEWERARPLVEEGLEIVRQLGDTQGIAMAQNNLGLVQVQLGDLESARRCFARSVELCHQLGNKAATADSMEELAKVAVRQHDPARAARLFGAAEALREAAESPLPPNEKPYYDRFVAELRGQVSPAEFAAAWSTGRALDLEEAVAFAVGDAPVHAVAFTTSCQTAAESPA